MKNYVLLDENNTVINISVADDNWDSTGWIDCTNKDVGIGFVYNRNEDIFIAPQPYPSWLRQGSFWYAPVDYPADGKRYDWNEATQTWDLDETAPK